ncbi:PREDICTED: uncharacterized protein LOC108559573 isoform X2 [Nicrophorus vespilloides]|uniref:Uncharacterized protein LOC108559573 isoform X2 n=1 Tax=Nicrophorus vespilloides TaxID=110193 RepID=A0ABM1MCU0_NICVS|nr:PREDICTED: uncharacterized protein LOC108559573 isoform X2 [Nicrophorus vespilloides]
MKLFKKLSFFAIVCLLCFNVVMGMSEYNCEKTLDCNGPNSLCIKNRCICMKSHKWDEENYECGTESTYEPPPQKTPEPDDRSVFLHRLHNNLLWA